MNVEDQRHEKPLSPWNRGKRIIVLTVFFLGLRGIDTPGKQALEECNKLYGLVNDPDALRFASLLAPRVWSGETWRHGLAELSSGHLSRAVQHFTKTLPRWLRYTRTETDIESDLRTAASRLIQHYSLC